MGSISTFLLKVYENEGRVWCDKDVLMEVSERKTAVLRKYFLSVYSLIQTTRANQSVMWSRTDL